VAQKKPLDFGGNLDHVTLGRVRLRLQLGGAKLRGTRHVCSPPCSMVLTRGWFSDPTHAGAPPLGIAL